MTVLKESLGYGVEQEQLSLNDLSIIATEIRRNAFATIEHAGSGHLGSCSSSAEMLSAMYFGGILKYDAENPRHPLRDRIILRGHLGPARYTVFGMLGWLDKEKLQHYRQLGGLPGHEEMDLTPGVDITPMGSFGMGLSYGAGAALAAKERGENFTTYVFLGDGEEQEGSVSESARHIATLGLDNLVCIMDKNGKQLSRDTQHSDRETDVHKLWESYGWDVVELHDGNDIAQVMETFKLVKTLRGPKPVIVIAHTTKGLGLPGAEDNFCGYHTISSCPPESLREAIIEQGQKLAGKDQTPDSVWELAYQISRANKLPEYRPDSPVEFVADFEPQPEEKNMMKGLERYRRQLAEYVLTGDNKPFVSMTADLMKQSLVDMYGFNPPINHIDTGVREIHMLATAYGMSVTDPRIRIMVTFAELTAYRGADAFNAFALGHAPVVVMGEGGGLNGSRDGLTHEITSIPGMLLTLPGIRMLEPADVRDAYNCLNKSLTHYNVPTYIRTHWRNTELLPRAEKDMHSTTYYEVDPADRPADIVLVGTGLTTQGGLDAKRLLATMGVHAKLINVVDIKALDQGFTEMVDEGAPILTLYNGYEFILRSAVSAALSNQDRKVPTVIKGHGFETGDTGTLEDLIKHFKLDGPGIVSVIAENFPQLFNGHQA
ncbi:MAG: 1-deoxy-D-xylulose-5-phosphate synthase N-terminal domain-containing protein [bacterium]